MNPSLRVSERSSTLGRQARELLPGCEDLSRNSQNLHINACEGRLHLVLICYFTLTLPLQLSLLFPHLVKWT